MNKFYIILPLLLALLVYNLNPSVPNGLEEKWKYQILMIFLKIVGSVGKFIGMFESGDDKLHNTLIGMNSVASFVSELYATDHFGPGVITSEADFNGTKVYIYQPPVTSDQLLPGFVYFRGGGLLYGNSKSFEGIAKKIAFRVNTVVINVDYTNTYYNKFPGPVNQAFGAVKWFMSHAEEYGVDPNRIAVGGDSAGGYLSTVISHLVHDDKSIPNLKLQILIYPWLQCLDFHMPSYQKYEADFGINTGFVNRQSMAIICSFHAWGITNLRLIQKLIENKHVSPSFRKSALYRKTFGHDLLPAAYRDNSYYKGASLPDDGDEDFWNESKEIFLDPRFTPQLRKNMTGLPTAYVMTVGYDSLRDEGYLYVQQLKRAGVNVTWAHYERGWHGIHWTKAGFTFRLQEKVHDDFLMFVRNNL